MDFANELRILVLSIIYALVGIALLFIAYKVFDWLTPGDMSKKIFEDANTAVGVTVGFFVLGIAVVIAAAIHG